MKRICVIGACCTRDAFNQKFVSNWRESFLLETYYFQPSIISMVSEPIPFCRTDLCQTGSMGMFETMLQSELNKDYLDGIVSVAPDAIVIDFYSDVINGVISVNDYSYITNRSRNWVKNSAYMRLQKVKELKAYKATSNYFELWKRSYDKFIYIIKKYLPNTKVIVNSCRCMTRYKKDGKIVDFDISKIPDVKKLNQVWDAFDKYAEKCGAELITYDNDYLLDEGYIFGGLWIVHYENKFYQDFFCKLKKKTMEVNAYKRCVVNNLIINGNFQHRSLFYRHWDKSFILSGGGVVVENKIGSTIPQVWSNLISNGNRNQKYVYSFYCLAKSPEHLKKNSMVAVIRTYEKVGLIFAKDCKTEFKICLNDGQINSDEWNRIEFEFEVDAPYFSCGLAVGPGVKVQYRDLNCYIKTSENEIACDDSIVERELLATDNMLIDVNETYIASIKQLVNSRYGCVGIIKDAIKNFKRGLNDMESKYLMSWTGDICSLDKSGFLVTGEAFTEHNNFVVFDFVAGKVVLKIIGASSEQYILDVKKDGHIVIGDEPKFFKVVDNGDGTVSISMSAGWLSAGRDKSIKLVENNRAWEHWKKIDRTQNCYKDIAAIYREELRKIRKELDMYVKMPYRSALVDPSLTYVYSSTDIVIGKNMTNSRKNYSKECIDAFFELTEKYYGRKERTGIFFDIGANIGTTSIYVKRVLNPQLKVIGVEIGEQNYRACKANCVLNGVEDIEVMHIGLGEEKASCKYFYSTRNPGASRIVYSDANNLETVNIMCFDELCSEKGIAASDIDYIWMDTEGFESKIIAGGMDILSGGTIPLMHEFNPEAYDDWERYKSNIRKCYSCFIDVNEYVNDKKNCMEYEISSLDVYKEKILRSKFKQSDIFLFSK